MSERAPVNKIIPFSLVDGPGSRTSIFLQGCNIACAYCHNPETQKLCCGCGICVEGCPAGALRLEDGLVIWNRQACISCDACIAACPNNASPKIMLQSAEEVFAEVAGYAPFIRGITVSGGECMLHPVFLEELFGLTKQAGLSCLIDSNGTVPFWDKPELMALCDGVMLDLKAWDEGVAERLTGQSPDLSLNVRKNLAYLNEAGLLEELRIVVVNVLGDPERSLEEAAAVLGSNCASTKLKLIRFRCFGVRGELSDAPSPSQERMEELRQLAESLGFQDIQITR